MGISNVPGVGPTNTDVANAVAAVVPSNANIQNIVTTYGNAYSWGSYGNLQQTITSSSNNLTANNNMVYAVVASGGMQQSSNLANYQLYTAAPSGGVSFGLVPKSSRAIVGGAGSPSSYGILQATSGYQNYYGGTGQVEYAPIAFGGSDVGKSGAAGGGGLQGSAGGNSIFGFNGGAGASSGGGGGAGIAGNGNAASGNTPGNGGLGGGGGGMNGTGGSASGTGGAGAILLFY
jgi:hypothetical protein